MTTMTISPTGRNVLNQFLLLPTDERKRILDVMADSIEAEIGESEWVNSCIEEADRRMERIRSGESNLIPSEIAMKGLRSRSA